MDFSIIIPTYNEEKYLERCIRSILNQKYERSKYEIIVSDAKSNDGTIKIAESLADKILVDERRGIAYGRNLGAQNANGNILIFVDADAILAQDFLFHTNLSFKDETIIAMSGIAHPNDGNILQRFVYFKTYRLAWLLNTLGLSLFPGVCVAYRKEKFLSLRGFREDFGIVEDLDLSRRASRIGKCFVNCKAKAYVSTRRLDKHLFSAVLFHIFCDIKYLLTGKAPSVYPKLEEIKSWRDYWKSIK